jgi:RimJ/RimL family protein N-acetyltransferase
MSNIAIRPLDPSEWRAFRDFRLAALKAAPGVFLTSHDEASGFPEDRWRTAIKGPAHQVFGLFDDALLIGITGTFTWDGDPSGATAILVMSFIAPEYRGRGLSRMLFEARLGWIRAQPQFTRVVVSHRASNEASRRGILGFGFVETKRAPHTWPDGITEDMISYRLDL